MLKLTVFQGSTSLTNQPNWAIMETNPKTVILSLEEEQNAKSYRVVGWGGGDEKLSDMAETCWGCHTICAQHMLRRWTRVSHNICTTHGEKMSGCVAHYMHDTWWEAEHVCRTLYAGHMVWRWAGVSHTICTILLQIRGWEGWGSHLFWGWGRLESKLNVI